MRLTILQDTFKEGLATVKPAVHTRASLAILGNVLLRATGGWLYLGATNLEIGIGTRLPARTYDDGAITLPARLLLEYVNALPSGDEIEIDLNKTATARLQCAGYKANIKGIAADDFPHIKGVDNMTDDGIKPVRLPAAAFKALVARVTFAAATDAARPVLTGVLCDMTDSGVTFAAADGFRLAVGSDASWQARTARAIIPAVALAEAGRLASGETVEMYLTGEQALFASGETELVSQLIGGNFPDYTQIVPKSHDTRATFDTAALLQAVRVANLFGRDSAGIVKLAVSEDGVIVSATSAETGDGTTRVDAEVNGPAVEIAFNARYLADALAAVGSEQAALELATGTSPGVVRSAGGDGWLCVIMPMNQTR